MTRKQTYQQALEGAGIPSEIASKAAEIISRDDPKNPIWVVLKKIKN